MLDLQSSYSSVQEDFNSLNIAYKSNVPLSSIQEMNKLEQRAIKSKKIIDDILSTVESIKKPNSK
jgi:hypothetical protein